MTTWLITGCSSGLGNALAHAVLKKGYNAIVTARNVNSLKEFIDIYPETALIHSLDVTNTSQIKEALKIGEEKFGGIDILINNAGYGYRSSIEEGDDLDIKKLFDTNVFGAVSVIKEILPSMRKRHTGIIVNISSVAPRIESPGSGYYSATKLALDGISATLRNEIKSLGIKVMVVQPGAFRTDFAGRSLHGSKINIADYNLTVGPRRKDNDKSSGKELGNPLKAANILVNVIMGEEIPHSLLLGSDAVEWATNAIQNELNEIKYWEKISISTDF